MDWREDFDDGEKFKALLRELIDDKTIEGPMLGMALKVIRDGVYSLSSKQAFIFHRDLVSEYTVNCRCCQDRIEWDEVVCAEMFNEGYCGRCAYSITFSR